MSEILEKSESTTLRQLTLFQEEFPVNQQVMQENEKEGMIIAGSGRKLLGLLGNYYRLSYFLKMLLDSPHWKTASHLMGYSLTWKTLAIGTPKPLPGKKSYRFQFQLAVLGPGTDGTEFGSYATGDKLIPTSSAHDRTNIQNFRKDSNIEEGGESFSQPGSLCKDVPNTKQQRLERIGSKPRNKTKLSGEGYQIISNPTNAGIKGMYKRKNSTSKEQWSIEPNVDRVANGIPQRMDRLKGLGNAIVPQVAYEIFKAIRNGL